MSAFIVVGDKTSHGGAVVSGTNFSSTGGQLIARKGDQVHCPQCKKMTTIIEGDQTMIVDGQPVALHGHKTSCGAVLISSQRPTTKEYGSSAANTNSFASFFSPYVAEEDDVRMKFNDYDQHFILIDDETGKPYFNRYYRMTCNEQVIEGKTDANGKTAKVVADEPADVKIEIFPEGHTGSSA